jgi:hypothetical protein
MLGYGAISIPLLKISITKHLTQPTIPHAQFPISPQPQLMLGYGAISIQISKISITRHLTQPTITIPHAPCPMPHAQSPIPYSKINHCLPINIRHSNIKSLAINN